MDIQDIENRIAVINISYVLVSSNNVFHIAGNSSYIVHERMIESKRMESAPAMRIEKLACAN